MMGRRCRPFSTQYTRVKSVRLPLDFYCATLIYKPTRVTRQQWTDYRLNPKTVRPTSRTFQTVYSDKARQFYNDHLTQDQRLKVDQVASHYAQTPVYYQDQLEHVMVWSDDHLTGRLYFRYPLNTSLWVYFQVVYDTQTIEICFFSSE